MGNSYSFKGYKKGDMAKAIGKSLPISFKQSIEICNFIRNKSVNYAKEVLSSVINDKRIIPFRRFNRDMGHKKKTAAGRYPKKASMEILGLINMVEANAQFKGLNTSNLMIAHISSNKASSTMRFGRKRNRKAKRTNIEIVVQEKGKVAEVKKSKIKKESSNRKSDSKEINIEGSKLQENKKLEKDLAKVREETKK